MPSIPSRVSSRIVAGLKKFQLVLEAAKARDINESDTCVIIADMLQEKRAHKTDSDYQFWEEGSHPQQISGEEVMRQKLESIHNNPVKRGYVNETWHWRSSSAADYEGKHGLMEIETGWR